MDLNSPPILLRECAAALRARLVPDGIDIQKIVNEWITCRGYVTDAEEPTTRQVAALLVGDAMEAALRAVLRIGATEIRANAVGNATLDYYERHGSPDLVAMAREIRRWREGEGAGGEV